MHAPNTVSSRALLAAVFARTQCGCLCIECQKERIELGLQLQASMTDEECPSRPSRHLDAEEKADAFDQLLDSLWSDDHYYESIEIAGEYHG